MTQKIENNKIPDNLYIVVDKCENLPDLRTKFEKAKHAISQWQVIFHGCKESIATPLVEGITEVNWMCECFVTLKTINKGFSMVVKDQKGRECGLVRIDLGDLPSAEDDGIKPGPEFREKRNQLRLQYRQQSSTLLSSSENSRCILKYWIWVTKFKDSSKIKHNNTMKLPMTNLIKLKYLSKSALIKFPNNSNLSTLNTNPFDELIDQDTMDSPGNPFTDGKIKDFENKFGNSSFANVQAEEFRRSIWIPRMESTNPFSRMRSSSLPQIEDVDQSISLKEEIKQLKNTLNRTSKVNSVPNCDLEDFFKLGELYRAGIKINNADEKVENNQNFFTLLNDIQRRYANFINQIKSLELEKEDLTCEMDHTTAELYKLKQKIVMNNLMDILHDETF